ncbi:hypothetical protein [Azospirillum argentinense]|uniref:hypothetical protein n=1 Tax=Azospirillum argentinense TaxID=2970906 RepID=UPI0032DFAF57
MSPFDELVSGALSAHDKESLARPRRGMTAFGALTAAPVPTRRAIVQPALRAGKTRGLEGRVVAIDELASLDRLVMAPIMEQAVKKAAETMARRFEEAFGLVASGAERFSEAMASVATSAAAARPEPAALSIKDLHAMVETLEAKRPGTLANPSREVPARALADLYASTGITETMLKRADFERDFGGAFKTEPPPVAESTEPSLSKSHDRWGLF